MFEHYIRVILDFVKWAPALAVLFAMMLLDVIAGILVALNKKTLNSTCSFRGITKKIFMLILVAVGAILEPFAQGIPVCKLICFAYIITETISITENAAVLGVPVPSIIIETLQKLRESQQKKITQKLPTKVMIELPQNPSEDTKVEITTKETKTK